MIVGTRIAVKLEWMTTGDGKRHVIYSKCTTSVGTIVKSMCGLWHTPAESSSPAERCPKCAPYALPTEAG